MWLRDSETAAPRPAPPGSAAARGTVALVLSQGCYFLFGYVAVVLLARALGPQDYAVYGVILSVLVWLEQVGRFAIPTAAAKLIAEGDASSRGLARATLFLNLLLYGGVFACLWLAAPLVARLLDIPDGTSLFRLAALDLPLFGAYTALQAIHQGNRRFLRLGGSGVVYALAKLAGVWLIIQLGVSVQKALLANVATTVAGIAFLLTPLGERRQSKWREAIQPILRIAGPMAVYSLFLMMAGNLNLWLLQLIRPAETAMTGVYLAGLNIARVPGYGLVAVAAVIVPSISRAVADEDRDLVRRYIYQALRFFLLLYLPVAFAVGFLSGDVMRLIYGAKYAGGGPLLALLLVSEGFNTVAAILGSVLVAVGRVWQAAWISCLSILASVALISLLALELGAAGAALAGALGGPVGVALMVRIIRKEYGPLLQERTGANTLAAALIMGLTASFLAGGFPAKLVIISAGVALYGLTLIVLKEITARDLAPLLGRR
ncbi:MAG: oligosaccharide flippase family protein [Acidobacteriota bacterium]